MDKFYIEKEELLELLAADTKKLVKASGPIAYVIACIGIFLTLLLLVPIVVLWLLLIIIYVPGYFIDTFILKYKKGNKYD